MGDRSLGHIEKERRRMGVRMSDELPALGDEVPVVVAGVYERAQNPWMRSGKKDDVPDPGGRLRPLRVRVL